MDTEASILLSVKKVLGIGEDDESFDPDIVMFINSALSTIAQVGISFPGGVSVTLENDLTWEDLDIGSMEFGDDTINVYSQVQTLIYLQVRMLFDPPTVSYLIDAMERQIQEHVWRLSAMREATGWVDPDPPAVVA